MKVLITTDLYKPLVNGVVTSVLNLKDELERRGHDVKILTLSPNRHSYISEDVYYVGSINTSMIYPSTRFRIIMPRAMYKELLAWKPDVVHSQCELSTFRYARKIAKACHAPLVHTYHTVYEDYTHYFCPIHSLGKRLVSFFSRHLLNKTDAVIVPSRKVDRLLHEYRVEAPISVIPTGIDIGRFSGVSSSVWLAMKKNALGLSDYELNLIYVGRLAREKHLEELINMIAKVRDIPVKLVIVGDGPAREELEKMTEELGAEDRILFTGMVSPDKVSDYYHLGDVFVNASTSETQGLTYTEALAAGLPLLCHEDECLDGVVLPGCNGWEYTGFDDFHSALEELANNMDLRERMSENALDTARNSSIPVFVDNVEKLYKKVAA